MPKGIPNKRCTPEFKKPVVETMQKEKLSDRETARQFEIGDHHRIQDWERIYLTEGPEGFTLNSFHIISFYWVVWSLFSIKDLKEFRNGFFFCPAISFSCRALGGYFSRTPMAV